MITTESISKFYEDVSALGLKFPVAAISKATGYSKGNVSLYLKKKDEPSQNFLTAFYREFGESIKKVPREKQLHNKAKKDGDLSLLQILDNLSESHKNLTAAHKEIAESNNKLADNEKEILSRMPATGSAEEESRIADASILVPLVEILADISSGKIKYRSKDEAMAELGMKLSLHKPGKGSRKGTPSGAGK